MDRRKGIDTMTTVELIQMVLKNKKKHEAKIRDVASKSREIQD